MDRLIRFTLRLSLIAATVAYVQTAAPTIQPHNGTLFLSHGSLIGGLSWGHIGYSGNQGNRHDIFNADTGKIHAK